MAEQKTTNVYPKPGVTLYLPGGVHGFGAGHGAAIPLPTEHAVPLIAAGHLHTDETREQEAAAAAAAQAQENGPSTSV